MWLSKKASEIDAGGETGSRVGIVSVGGVRPAVVCDGEIRSAELCFAGGVVYVPRAGDEVLLERTCDDEHIVIGRLVEDLPEGISEGEIFISGNNGSIYIRNNGVIEINGSLFVNGVPYGNGE